MVKERTKVIYPVLVVEVKRWWSVVSSQLGFWTLDFGLWTLDFGLWTLDFGLWTLTFGL